MNELKIVCKEELRATGSRGKNEREVMQSMPRTRRKDGEETARPAHWKGFKCDWHENRKTCHIIKEQAGVWEGKK